MDRESIARWEKKSIKRKENIIFETRSTTDGINKRVNIAK